jgi:23S rRNA (adenine2503-C2)-methyltransferase
VALLYDLSAEQIATLLGDEPPYRVRQVWENLYRRALTPDEMTDLPLALRQRLSEETASLAPTARVECDSGQTVKHLHTLADGVRIESVVMRYPNRTTVCVSTQAGCAMACQFCATGQAGFARHLTAGEIVGQVIEGQRAARPRRVSNVVFMGMGEPLANYRATLESIRRLTGDMGMSARSLTVSTVGMVPGVRQLAEEGIAVNLAVSLHAARDDLRDELVPINRRYPLGVLAEACAGYFEATRRRISFEWALIDQVNDTPDDVAELAAYARPLRAHVNLIPLNPTPGYPMPGSPRRRVEAFERELRLEGVNVTVRDTRGTDIDAACGQLAARTLQQDVQAGSG